eukprot:1151750-Pelagomonas_calceolata.AAC.10
MTKQREHSMALYVAECSMRFRPKSTAFQVSCMPEAALSDLVIDLELRRIMCNACLSVVKQTSMYEPAACYKKKGKAQLTWYLSSASSIKYFICEILASFSLLAVCIGQCVVQIHTAGEVWCLSHAAQGTTITCFTGRARATCSLRDSVCRYSSYGHKCFEGQALVTYEPCASVHTLAQAALPRRAPLASWAKHIGFDLPTSLAPDNWQQSLVFRP